MIVTLRGGKAFWHAVLHGAEQALAGEYFVIQPRDDNRSEPEVEIRFLPMDEQDNFAILVLSDPDVPDSLDPWAEYAEREAALDD